MLTSTCYTFVTDKAITQLSFCISWYPRVPGGWNPKDYDGITNFTVDTYELWRPDIEVFNHVEFPQLFTENSYFIVLDSSGVLEWCPRGRAVVNCDTDMSHFPHDEHECSLLIGSATYDYDKLKLEPSLIQEPEDLQLNKRPISSNWQLIETGFQLVKGEHNDYFDYACKLRLRVRRRFSLHLYTFSLTLFCCAALTVMFCWLPLSDERRFQLALLSVIVNLFLMIRYSDTLQHSTSTPWGLRFAGDLMLFTCCMLVLQMLCLALEDALVPFATHPVVDQFLSTTIVSTYILSDRHVLLEDEDNDHGQVDSAEVAGSGFREADYESGPFGGVAPSPARITTETTVVSEVNEKWRDLLVALMRICVTAFLIGYAFTYYVLDRYGVF